MNNQLWSWILTVVGVTGFILAGKKIWWAWYINIACQGLWMAYALATRQYGFIVAAVVYTFVFTNNAIKWTRDRDVSPVCQLYHPGEPCRPGNNHPTIKDLTKGQNNKTSFQGKHRKPEIIYFEHNAEGLWRE